MKARILEGNLVDVLRGEIYPARIHFKEKILGIERGRKKYPHYILPGLIDAHLHIESTMLCPSRFCEATLPHGTVGVVADPHEIANVAGIGGVLYMLRDTPRWSKIRYMAPSCVPATRFETSGARLGPKEVKGLLEREEILGLGEVMDFPAVLQGEKEVMEKIGAARRSGKRVDGHAPSLKKEKLDRYFRAGIETDHEVVALEEGRERLQKGMKLAIRQGSTARCMPELISLVREFPDRCFLVGDDVHVGDLACGHVDALLREAVKLGLDPLLAVKCCTLNPARHYGLNTGIIEVGAPSDFVVVRDLKGFRALEVWVNGKRVSERGRCLVRVKPKRFPLRIARYKLTEEDFFVRAKGRKARVRVIGVTPGQIRTEARVAELLVEGGKVLPSKGRGIAYLAVVNRYRRAPVSKAFVQGLWVEGALASSVAHDSHNLVVAGSDAGDMCEVARALMGRGGLAFSRRGRVQLAALPIAGLMSDERAGELAGKLERLHRSVRRAGCKLPNPFAQLSFLTLLVIPELRLSDRGLFDSRNFKFVNLFLE